MARDSGYRPNKDAIEGEPVPPKGKGSSMWRDKELLRLKLQYLEGLIKLRESRPFIGHKGVDDRIGIACDSIEKDLNL